MPTGNGRELVSKSLTQATRQKRGVILRDIYKLKDVCITQTSFWLFIYLSCLFEPNGSKRRKLQVTNQCYFIYKLRTGTTKKRYYRRSPQKKDTYSTFSFVGWYDDIGFSQRGSFRTKCTRTTVLFCDDLYSEYHEDDVAIDNNLRLVGTVSDKGSRRIFHDVPTIYRWILSLLQISLV